MFRIVSVLLALSLWFPLMVHAELTHEQQQELQGVARAVQKSFPDLPLRKVSTTPVEGLYELITVRDDFLYFVPKSGHLLTGELWNSAGQNLTSVSRGRMMEERLQMLPLDKAIKIGSGPNQVVEISDPDCPFCRDGSEFFSARDDVTRYIFLFPLDRIHPKAALKSSYILSSADPRQAYKAVYAGAFDEQPLPEFVDNGLLLEHRKAANSIGVRGTPQYWINGRYISGTNLDEFAKLLDQGPTADQ